MHHQANRPIGRYSAAELDRLLAQREHAVIERRRVRHAHRFVLPDMTEIRPQLAEDIASGDDFNTAQCRATTSRPPPNQILGTRPGRPVKGQRPDPAKRG